MTQHDLFVIIGKQAAVIENYKNLLEQMDDWYYYSDEQLVAMKRVRELAEEILK